MRSKEDWIYYRGTEKCTDTISATKQTKRGIILKIVIENHNNNYWILRGKSYAEIPIHNIVYWLRGTGMFIVQVLKDMDDGKLYDARIK